MRTGRGSGRLQYNASRNYEVVLSADRTSRQGWTSAQSSGAPPCVTLGYQSDPMVYMKRTSNSCTTMISSDFAPDCWVLDVPFLQSP
jgi:hypothetical protein